jgi:hypothetical protein
MPTGPCLTLPQNHQHFSLSRHHLLGKTFLTMLTSTTKAHSSLCNSQKPWQVHGKCSSDIQTIAKYEKCRVRMTTSGNGCQGRSHIYITSWIEKLHQKIGDAPSATRMGSTNVKIVLGSHSIAPAVAELNIVAILSTGSVNGMVNSSSKVVSLMSDSSYTSVMMANNVRYSQIGGICLKKTNLKTSLSLKIYHLCRDPSSSQRKTPWSSLTSPEFIASRFDAVIVQMP